MLGGASTRSVGDHFVGSSCVVHGQSEEFERL
jgi:hypothetical protein